MADLSKQCDETDGFKPEGVFNNKPNNQSPLRRKQGGKKTKLKGER